MNFRIRYKLRSIRRVQPILQYFFLHLINKLISVLQLLLFHFCSQLLARLLVKYFVFRKMFSLLDTPPTLRYLFKKTSQNKKFILATLNQLEMKTSTPRVCVCVFNHFCDIHRGDCHECHNLTLMKIQIE